MEYACRAGSTSEFHFGDNAAQITEFGNIADLTLKQKFPGATSPDASDGYLAISPVGSFRPNAYGLYDMHGNVLEWCSDWYEDYSTIDVTDPSGPTDGEYRIYRGGTWYFSAGLCRSAIRFCDPPGFSYYILGFRLVCETE